MIKKIKQKFIAVFILIFVISNFLNFQVPYGKAMMIGPDPTGINITGQVTDLQTQNPLANVTVKLLVRDPLDWYIWCDENDVCENSCTAPSYPKDNWCYTVEWETTTDNNGNYLLENTYACDLGADRVWYSDLEFSKDNYNTKIIEDINGICGETMTKDALLVPNENTPAWRQDILPGDILYDPYTSGVGHTGLYIGNGLVVEAQGVPFPLTGHPGLVNENNITKWDYPSRKDAYILRIKNRNGLSEEAMKLIKNNAIHFAIKQYDEKKPYDWSWHQKNSDTNSPSWYCSELVWAAYVNQGIDLEYSHDPLGVVSPISPSEIFQDDDVEIINSHLSTEPGTWRDYVFLLVFSPVNITVIDDQGHTFNKDTIGDIPGALYLEDEVDENGHVRDRVVLLNGHYQIIVTPKAGADPNDTYSLVLETDGQQTSLAQDVKIADIPDEPYIINSTSDGGGGHGPGGFVGGFSDTEESSANTYQAGTLDAVFSSANNFSPTTTPSQIATTTAVAQNNGSLDFQSKISAENFPGDNDLCAALNLQVNKNSAEIYNSALTDFYVATSTLIASATDNFDFIASLPADADLGLQNKTCGFDLKLESWQTGTDDENSGFNDEEILSFSISSGEWSATPAAPFVPGPGDVVINEIMWMGSVYDTNVLKENDEWIELRNMTSNDIDLTNWQLEHSAESQGSLILSGTLQANEYFIITNYNKNNSLINVDVNQATTTISLNNYYDTNGAVILKNNTGDIIDSTPTPTSDNWPAGINENSPNYKKWSMERTLTPGDGTLNTSWHTCDRTDGVMNAPDLATMLSYWDSDAQN